MKKTIIHIISILFFLSTNTLFAQNGTIDAAFALNKTYSIFIAGDRVVKYNMSSSKVEGIYQLSRGAFPGMQFTRVDAVLNYRNGKIYFFSGNQYYRFDLKTFRADAGYPVSIAGYWKGLPANGITAAIDWKDKAYFFKAYQYYRFDKKTNQSNNSYPRELSNNTWPGLPSVIDAGFSDFNGKTYFFSGDYYYRYSVNGSKCDAGYPASTSQYWPGLYEALFQNNTPPPTTNSGTKINFNIDFVIDLTNLFRRN